MTGFHQVSLIQTAAAIRPNSSTVAALNFTLSIWERSRISSLVRRRGISRKQLPPSLAERATTASVITGTPGLKPHSWGTGYSQSAVLPIRVNPELRANLNWWLRFGAQRGQLVLSGGCPSRVTRIVRQRCGRVAGV